MGRNTPRPQWSEVCRLGARGLPGVSLGLGPKLYRPAFQLPCSVLLGPGPCLRTSCIPCGERAELAPEPSGLTNCFNYPDGNYSGLLGEQRYPVPQVFFLFVVMGPILTRALCEPALKAWKCCLSVKCGHGVFT